MKDSMKPQRGKPRQITNYIIVLFAALTWSTITPAQQPIVLTLQDALKFALVENQQVKKAKLDVENSQYRIDEVRARALPQLNGSSALTYNPILQLSALPGELAGQPGKTLLIPFGQKWNANAALSASQALFDQSVLTGLKAAKSTAQYYKQNVQLREEELLEQVSTNYYRVLVQRQQLNVIESNINNTTKIQQILKGQYENGLAKKIDLDRLAVSLSNLRSRRQQLLNAVALLENQLKFFMGMPIETAVIIPDAPLNTIQPKAVFANDTVDVSGRTELLALRTQEDLLRYQREAYQSEYYPSLSVSGAYSYQGLSQKFPVFRGQEKGANWFDVASVGLNLRIPIFNGFATRARVRQSNVSIRKLQEDISLTKLSLNLAFENAKTQINNSIITLNSQKDNVALAQEIYFNTQNNYNNGLAPLTDLLSAENSLTEAQNNYSSALLDYRVAEIQLLKAQGTLKSLLN